VPEQVLDYLARTITHMAATSKARSIGCSPTQNSTTSR
jgi:hypothetical protein